MKKHKCEELGYVVLFEDAKTYANDCFKCGIQVALLFGEEKARKILEDLEKQDVQNLEQHADRSFGGRPAGDAHEDPNNAGVSGS